jgi:1-acyl-sn-glycerol-3-phosphate acyltransferase
LSWVFKAARAIPIAGRHEDADIMQRAFEEVDKALADGELVCIFPEGSLTKNGQIDTFRPGVERILERRAVPVVPMAIQGMWASIFSRKGVVSVYRIPGRLRAPVGVRAEPAVPGETATAELLEMKVRALRGDWA